MNFHNLFCAGLLAACSAISLPAQVLSYRVDLTIPSGVTTGAPFSLDLSLIDGGGLVSNTITATNFTFNAGGGFAGGATSTGGVSGSFASGGFTLTDSSFFNDVFLQLAPGTTFLSFIVTQTNNLESGSPDAFSVSLLDNSLFNISTTDSVASTLVFANLGGSAPSLGVTAFSGSGAYSGVVAAVPEPGTVIGGILGFGLVVGGGLRARARRQAQVVA